MQLKALPFRAGRRSSRPEILARALREANVEARICKKIEDSCHYAWEAVLYRGVLYAQQILDLGRPVLIKLRRPSDRRSRERLRNPWRGADL